jgi:LysM repeat protein
LLVGSRTKSEPTAWEEYIVSSGDTVSGIASEVTQDTEDYRVNQNYIIKKNNIKNGMIYPGQVILVPVEGER